jgi:hypothetical protein
MHDLSAFIFTGIAVGCLGVLAGCSSPVAGGSGLSTVPLASDGASAVYVSQPAIDRAITGTVARYPASANETASPTATIATPSTTANSYVAADQSGQLYVGIQAGKPEVLVFPAGSSGTASPARMILGSAASFNVPGPMVVDSASQLYVVDPTGSISVFSSAANGATAPMRHIQGSLTQLADAAVPSAISVDAAGNVYVALESTSANVAEWTILVFSPSATGNVAPARVITASNQCSLDNSFQVALDAKGNFYVACWENEASEIIEFASNGTTAAIPVKAITGPATGLGTVLALSVDGAGNVYALNYTQNVGLSVEAFGASGSGNISPAIRFNSGSMTSIFPRLALR